MWRYSRISKLSKTFTYKNPPSSNQNKACFSSLVGFKSPSASSSRYDYMTNNYPNSLCLVKQYHNSGSLKWYETSKEFLLEFLPSNVENLLLHTTGATALVLLILRLSFVIISEKQPYTNRRHIVLLPPCCEKDLGEHFFKNMQLSNVLSEEHPDSVRVKMIGEKIVEALESDLEAMKNQNVRVDHLVGCEWKFLVVKDSDYRAHSKPGGKIFVNTGVLQILESDAEIATVLAHEVGHHVARHIANRYNVLMLEGFIARTYGLNLKLQLVMDDHQRPHGVSEWIRVYLFQYPKWRRQEREADDIGLLLMASAGYDPQVAPKLYERFVHLSPPGSDFYYPHPSEKKRAKNLARGKVMKEAITRYSKVIETRKMNDLKDR